MSNTTEQTTEQLRAVSAYPSQANTPETDMQLEVLHDVTLSDGDIVTVRAACPSDAIDMVDRALRVK